MEGNINDEDIVDSEDDEENSRNLGNEYESLLNSSSDENDIEHLMDGSGDEGENFLEGVIAIEDIMDHEIPTVSANVDILPSSSENAQPDFDTQLPNQHTYLGDSFNQLTGRTIFGDNEIVELYVPPQSIPPPVPGQVIPLAFFHNRAISTVRRVIQGNHTFGILSRRDVGETPDIGTTVEILQWFGRSGIPGFGQFGLDFGLRAKAEARQRFKVLKTYSKTEGEHVHPVALVQILPEVPVTKMLGPYVSGHVNRTRRVKQAHQLTPWPAFVFDQYDPEILLKKILVEVEKLFDGNVIITKMPKLETIELCYWLILQLPLSESFRMELLAMNSVVQRLRAILSILKESGRTVCCKSCSHLIARSCDAIALSVHGTHGTFVNPGGYVHETLTYTRAVGIQVTTQPSTEFSWFPGYAWQIVVCDSCLNHLGWKFTNKNMNPKQFLCFTKSALDLQMSKQNANLSECTWVM